MPGRVHPVPAAQDQPLRGFVSPCCGMCRGSGVFSCEGAGCCREGGTAACAFRNDARAYAHLFVSCSPLSVLTGSGSVENKRQTVRTKHNTFPWRGKKKICLRTARLALKRRPRALHSGLRHSEPWQTLRSVLRDVPCPARPS